MKNIGLCVVMLIMTVSACQAQNQNLQSQYTSIREVDCKNPHESIVAKYQERDLIVQECPGSGSWKVYFVSSDARSWLDLVTDNKIWSTEEQVVYKNQFGNFPNLGADKIEWRQNNKNQPVGLIFRIAAQDPNNADKNLSRLFVLRLEKTQIAFCGIAKTNEEARQLLIAENQCNALLQVSQ